MPPSATSMTLQQALILAQDLLNKGQLREADSVLQQILSAVPEQPQALHLLGRLALQANRPDIAVQCFLRQLQSSPSDPVAHIDLGNAELKLGHLNEAIAAYRKAIELQPENAGIYSNLGVALHEQGHVEEALCQFEKAVTLNPSLPDGYNNVGTALRNMGRFDEAIQAFRKAAELRSNWAEAHINLANTLKSAGRMEEAIAECRRALQMKPESAMIHSSLVVYIQYDLGSTPAEIFEEHRRWNQVHAVPLGDRIKPHTNDRSPERRLRIGYVSPDFREHSVPFFFEGLLSAHDRERVEVFCYADLLRKPDPVSERLKALSDHWINITGMGDEPLAERIREDRIDILVDLAGHTAGGRLLVFARKPAPVQVSYLGYPNTTGLDAIDYYITDVHLDPPGTSEQYFSEQLIRLPQTFACYRAPQDAPPVGILPARSNGYVTFASFNTLPKINERVIQTWAKILSALPESRLLISARGMQIASVADRMREAFSRHGIDPQRLRFEGYRDQKEYFATHNEVDLLLDTFPVNGHTITCHALWMGVPAISLAGDRHSGRLGASVLKNLGLPELLASSIDEYVRIAVELASDLPRLEMLRSTMRDRMLRSALMDEKKLANQIEDAHRSMWRKYVSG